MQKKLPPHKYQPAKNLIVRNTSLKSISATRASAEPSSATAAHRRPPLAPSTSTGQSDGPLSMMSVAQVGAQTRRNYSRYAIGCVNSAYKIFTQSIVHLIAISYCFTDYECNDPTTNSTTNAVSTRGSNSSTYFVNDLVTYRCSGGRFLDTDRNADGFDIYCRGGSGGLQWYYLNGAAVDFSSMPTCVHSEFIISLITGVQFNTVLKTVPKIVPKNVPNSLSVQIPIFLIF